MPAPLTPALSPLPGGEGVYRRRAQIPPMERRPLKINVVVRIAMSHTPCYFDRHYVRKPRYGSSGGITRTPRITGEVATAEARAGALGVPQNPESHGFGRRPGDCAGWSDPVAMRSGLVPRARRS